MTRHATLAEYFWLAGQVTGIGADTLAKESRSDLAESALHAPLVENRLTPEGMGRLESCAMSTGQVRGARMAIAAGLPGVRRRFWVG